MESNEGATLPYVLETYPVMFYSSKAETTLLTTTNMYGMKSYLIFVRDTTDMSV